MSTDAAVVAAAAVRHAAACIFALGTRDAYPTHVTCDALYALHAYMRTLADADVLTAEGKFAIPPQVLAAACIVAAEWTVTDAGRDAYVAEPARLDALVHACFSYFDRPLARSAELAKRATLAKAREVDASRGDEPWDFPRRSVLREIGKILPAGAATKTTTTTAAASDDTARDAVVAAARTHAKAAFTDARMALDADARNLALACLCLVVVAHRVYDERVELGDTRRRIAAEVTDADADELVAMQRRIVAAYGANARVVRCIVEGH